MEEFSPDKSGKSAPPVHIAIIMDGNGRWAERKGLSRIHGYRKGIEVVRDIIAFSGELGIKYLTLYTFSRENWKRPAYEVDILMMFLEKHLRAELPLMEKHNIRLSVIGNLHELPKSVRKAIKEIEEKTGKNDGMRLNLAISYSGRSELVEAMKIMAGKVRRGELFPEDITEETVQDALYTKDIPDPDLLIRTSGERRISNFLLWQLAYTELYVTDVLWPDFTRQDLLTAIKDFSSRERRFGLTASQLIEGRDTQSGFIPETR